MLDSLLAQQEQTSCGIGSFQVIDPEPGGGSRPVLLSVRPQFIRLHSDRPSSPGGRPVVPGVVAQRVFLGETWDYVVQSQGSGTRLRVTAPPLQVHEIGDAVWI